MLSAETAEHSFLRKIKLQASSRGCPTCQGLSYQERWHRVSDDGEVSPCNNPLKVKILSQSAGKSGPKFREIHKMFNFLSGKYYFLRVK